MQAGVRANDDKDEAARHRAARVVCVDPTTQKPVRVTPGECAYFADDRRLTDTCAPVVTDGAILVPDFPNGAETVAVNIIVPEGYVALRGLRLKPGEARTVRLVPGRGVRGNVRLEDGGPTPPGLQVWAYWRSTFPEDKEMTSAEVEPDGAFRLARLPRGRAIRVMALGGRKGDAGLSDQVVLGPKSEEVQLILRRGGAIKGHVSSNESDTSSWTIRAIQEHARIPHLAGMPVRKLDTTGQFDIEGIPPGSYYLLVQDGDDTTRAITNAVPVGSLDLDIKLPRRVHVVGKVLGGVRQPAVLLTAWWADRQIVLETPEEVGGQFAMDLVPGLRYTFVAKQGDRIGVLANIRLPAESSELTLTLADATTLVVKPEEVGGQAYVVASRDGAAWSAWSPYGESATLHVPRSGKYSVFALSVPQFYGQVMVSLGQAMPVEGDSFSTVAVDAVASDQKIVVPVQ
jgi:hypothetical protein